MKAGRARLNPRPLSTGPVIEQYDNITVVRDDLLPGGTKSRFCDQVFEGYDEIVYATPQEGGAQTALSLAAKRLGKQLTLFVAARKVRHERVELSAALGARVIEAKPGYLSHIQARAAEYAGRMRLLHQEHILYLRFGLDSEFAVESIARAARQVPKPEALWFAAGSGTLARGMARAWPDVPRFAVQVGHKLTRTDVAGAKLIDSGMKFSDREEEVPPFQSDLHYDAKAFRMCIEKTKGRPATFWNVAGPASVYFKYANIGAVIPKPPQG